MKPALQILLIIKKEENYRLSNIFWVKRFMPSTRYRINFSTLGLDVSFIKGFCIPRDSLVGMQN